MLKPIVTALQLWHKTPNCPTATESHRTSGLGLDRAAFVTHSVVPMTQHETGSELERPGN